MDKDAKCGNSEFSKNAVKLSTCPHAEFRFRLTIYFNNEDRIATVITKLDCHVNLNCV